MRYYTPTQDDLRIVKQQTKDLFVRIDLLNREYKILDSFDAVLLNDNLSVDGQAAQRRSYSCDLYVPDVSFIIGDDKKIWIDKYIQVYYGIKSNKTKQIQYWLIGTFSYQSVDYTYDATSKQLSLKCPDLMADYDGTKNGQISGYELLIKAGEDIRTAVIGTLRAAGITKYYVEDIKKEIPYDLEFSGTKTWCDVWTKICELYDSWQFYFDVDGTFIWKKIPTGLHEDVSLDDSFIDDIWISENTSYDFTKIYNKTEVWGKVLELQYEDRYTEECSFSNGIYTINLPKIGNMEAAEKTENQEIIDYVASADELDHLDQIAIKICANSVGGDKVKIGSSLIPIVNDDGTPIAAKYYVTSDTKAPTYSLPDNATWQEHMEAYKKDSLSVKIDRKTWDINIDSLPIVLREEGEGKAHHIRIYAETNEPYSKMKNLTIYYDFEVGEERFVSKKIKYKWRMYIDCRPKWW